MNHEKEYVRQVDLASTYFEDIKDAYDHETYVKCNKSLHDDEVKPDRETIVEDYVILGFALLLIDEIMRIFL